MSFVTGRGRYARATYPQSPGAAGGATVVAPYSLAAFVDPGTTVPLAAQNGSVLAPFATLQQAIDAAAGLVNIYLFGNPVSSLTVPANLQVGIRAMEPGFSPIDLILGDGAKVVLEDCIAETASMTGSSCELHMLVSEKQSISDNVSRLNLPGGFVRLTNVGLFGFGPTCITAADVFLDGCSTDFGGAVTSIDCATLKAINTRFYNGTIRSTSLSTFIDCEYPSGNITVDNVGSTPAEFDAYSNYRFKNAGGCSVLNPGKVVIADLVA